MNRADPVTENKKSVSLKSTSDQCNYFLKIFQNLPLLITHIFIYIFNKCKIHFITIDWYRSFICKRASNGSKLVIFELEIYLSQTISVCKYLRVTQFLCSAKCTQLVLRAWSEHRLLIEPREHAAVACLQLHAAGGRQLSVGLIKVAGLQVVDYFLYLSPANRALSASAALAGWSIPDRDMRASAPPNHKSAAEFSPVGDPFGRRLGAAVASSAPPTRTPQRGLCSPSAALN